MQKQLAIKIVTIIIIGLVILIPVTLVQSKIYERQGYFSNAKYAVAQSWTGEQLLLTPVLVIPYQVTVPRVKGDNSDYSHEQPYEKQTAVIDKYRLLEPTTIIGDIATANKKLFKGIYEIPVYNSEVSISGTFDSQALRDQINAIQSTSGFSSMGNPYISMYISDVRGIDVTPSFSFNKQSIPLKPGSHLPSLASGLHAELPATTADDEFHESYEFTFSMSLRGMASLSFVALADKASMNLTSDWPHPEFIGASLPFDRTISAEGFSATWKSTRYSSNSMELLKSCINYNQCHEVLNTGMGVNFIEPVDVYLQSERAIKYAMLFIGLSFITFFIFEHVKSIRIHPIQYTFVGLATATFYLLLISLAEHIAFHWAYLIAVFCCSSLLLFYVRYILRHFYSALLFFVMIVTLYGLLYVIVQAEDFALLMGALLVFSLLSILMVVTRKIDWYALSIPEQAVNPKNANK